MNKDTHRILSCESFWFHELMPVLEKLDQDLEFAGGLENGDLGIEDVSEINEQFHKLSSILRDADEFLKETKRGKYYEPKEPKRWVCTKCGHRSKNPKLHQVVLSHLEKIKFYGCAKCAGKVEESEEWLEWHNKKREELLEQIKANGGTFLGRQVFPDATDTK